MQPGDQSMGPWVIQVWVQTPSPPLMSLTEPRFPQICNGDSAW